MEVSRCHGHPKEGPEEDLGNYRSVSLASVLGKLTKQIIPSAIMQHMQHTQGSRPSQQELMKGRSCSTNLISSCDKVICLVDEGNAGKCLCGLQ